jgi:hypothetical protein
MWMKSIALFLVPITAALSISLAGCATNAAEQHKAHHPGNTAAGQGKMEMMSGSMQMAGMDENRMGMCKKMMSAKSPEERKAMMDEHMKSMSPEMREKCIEMMHSRIGSQTPSK